MAAATAKAASSTGTGDGATSTGAKGISVTARPSKERGHANHGWLDSYHSFSFAGYYDPRHDGWGPLRVINEDIVSPSQGFGRHPHRTFEIFSYPLAGALRHDDSMGHSEVIRRGDVQFTSAGTGIAHSEYNASKTEQVKFLQIWLTPSRGGLKPRYETKRFEDEAKKDTLLPIVAQGGRGGAIACDDAAAVYASILSEGAEVQHEFDGGAARSSSADAADEAPAKSRVGYIHVPLVPGSRSKGLKLSSGQVLAPGDGAYLRVADGAKGEDASLGFTAVGGATEFLLFDMTQS